MLPLNEIIPSIDLNVLLFIYHVFVVCKKGVQRIFLCTPVK